MANVDLFIARRKQRKLSQQALCDGICTQATLSKFERQAQVPSIDIMVNLCERLNLTLNDIFPVAPSLPATADEVRLQQAIWCQVHQDVTRYRALVRQITVTELPAEQRAVFYLSTYLAALFFEDDLVAAKACHARVQARSLPDDYRLLLYATIASYHHRVGHDVEAGQLFDRIWHEEQQAAPAAQRANVGIPRVATIYLMALFYWRSNKPQHAASLATYGIDLLQTTDQMFLLENFFLLLADAGKAWQNHDFVTQEMLVNARTIAKYHHNDLILQGIAERLAQLESVTE